MIEDVNKSSLTDFTELGESKRMFSSYLTIQNETENKKLKRRRNHPFLSAVKLENDWLWDNCSKSECVSLSDDLKTAYFFDNPYTISRGTAGIRGNKTLENGIHYFEILVKEPLYGTAVMIGVGTEDVCLHYDNFDYVHMVGKDSNSWGLCHKGKIWHNGSFKQYCDPFFDKDLTVGVLLNNHDKTLHYFINGVYQGLAFKNVNIENKKLYPILSSTATDVELELISSCKLIYSLQDICCQNIIKMYKNFDSLPLAKRLINYLKEY